MTFEVLFTGTQGLHANVLLPPMAWRNARNCPHDQAPGKYAVDGRGFMCRLFFPMGEGTVAYPPV